MRRQGGELLNNLPHNEVVVIAEKKLDLAHDATSASHTIQHRRHGDSLKSAIIYPNQTL